MNYASSLLVGGLLAGSLFTIAAVVATDGVSLPSGTYTVTKLAVDGCNIEDISGMNASGQIIFVASVTIATTNTPPAGNQGWKSIPTLRDFIASEGKLQDIGNLGGQGTVAVAINDSGQVAGSAQTEPWPPNAAPWQGPPEHAFLYEKGTISDLGTLGGKFSRANAINASGQIVGQAGTANSTRHAFLYSNGEMQDLGVLGGMDSDAFFINDAGQIAGVADTNPNVRANATTEAQQHAFLYQNNKMRDLGTFGGKNSQPYAMNAAGDVVGAADVTLTVATPGSFVPLTAHAFLYHNGKMRDLGTFGGKDSLANAINDAGQVVGSADIHTEAPANANEPERVTHAFLFSGGKMRDLGALNAKNSVAVAINSAGQIVGIVFDQLDWVNSRPFLYDNGKMQDLNLVIGDAALAQAGLKTLLTAKNINDRGQISGTALDKDGKKAVYLLTPVKS